MRPRLRFSRILRIFLGLSLCLGLGCTLYQPNLKPRPEPNSPATFSFPVTSVDPSTPWWGDFGDPILARYIESSIPANFSLRAAFARIKQARALAKRVGAERDYELSGSASSGVSKVEGENSNRRYDAALDVSWDVDLFGRLESAYQSEVFETKATEEDYRATLLLLTGEVADTYFQLMEQYLTLELLQEQLEASQEILRRIELRFGQGQEEVNIVDVLQQRSQVASVQAQFPLPKANAKVLSNRLSVLLGQPPTSATYETGANFPSFSEEFQAGVPSDLLMQRPDLRASANRLVSIDYAIGEAIADQYPRFVLSADAGIAKTLNPTALFASALAEAVGPIIDKGRRQAEIERRRALFEEELADFSELFLTSIEEVENALWRQIHQEQLIEALENERVTRVKLLNESRIRYAQGGSDYLPVLAALQSLQDVERELISRRRELLSIRVFLHLALGGPLSHANLTP
ncbi:MAG: efflux transporter outer membrane subunit [Candidatus Omnitrophica bacterium]|nr:efflux transporter outer membrane subunit [Candidatus Omnitrophota bacterium]